MQPRSLLALALGTLASAAVAQDADTIIDLYPDCGCPGSDPVATISSSKLDGYCHPFGPFLSSQVTLNFTGATQLLYFYDDDACQTQSLELGNSGGGQVIQADGQCESHAENGAGWRSFKYETYR